MIQKSTRYLRLLPAVSLFTLSLLLSGCSSGNSERKLADAADAINAAIEQDLSMDSYEFTISDGTYLNDTKYELQTTAYICVSEDGGRNYYVAGIPSDKTSSFTVEHKIIGDSHYHRIFDKNKGEYHIPADLTSQSAAQTESQTAGNQRETGDLSGDEVSAAQHCILLAGKNGTWLLADRDNGTVFTTSIPNDLKDNDGKKITSEILKAGDYVDVYGDGIMLESYPGQYPGVSKMVVTGEGTADEVKQYQDVIDMVFAEPDTSTVPTVGVVYSSSLGQTMSLMSGPGNSTWTAPSGDSETDSSEDNTVTACGSAVMQWENLEKMSMDAGKTDFTISCDLTPTKVTVRRWNSDKYPASADDDLDALAEEVNVEKSADGEFVVRDVEPGYVYEVTVSWEYGDAQYGFMTSEIQ